MRRERLDGSSSSPAAARVGRRLPALFERSLQEAYGRKTRSASVRTTRRPVRRARPSEPRAGTLTPPCRYGRSPEVTSELAARFDHRPYGQSTA